MAKKKEAPREVYDAPAAPTGTSPLDMILGANRRKGAGLPTWTIDELRARTFGIEPYSLPLQFICAGNIIPLPSIIQLAGPPKTYKTSGALEFLSMVLPPRFHQGDGRGTGMPTYAGGACVFLPTEGKVSTTKVQSMLREHSGHCRVAPSASADAWQTELTDILKGMLDYQAKCIESELTKGKKMQDYFQRYLGPLAVAVDSLTGAQSQEMVDKVHDEGSVGRSFQERAIRNTNWLSVWASQMGTLPAFLLLTNHEKDPINDQGMAFDKRTPGGVATNYYTTYDIRVKKIKEIKTSRTEGAVLQWRMHHNSYGTDKRFLEVPYIETYDEKDAQLAYYDWDTALTHLLLRLKDDDLLGDRLAEFLTVVEHDGQPKTYSCAQLGITREQAKEEKITAEVFGKRMHTSAECRKLFRKVLRVEEYLTWYPGVDVHRSSPELARLAG